VGARSLKRTRYPGIYEVLGGRTRRFMVSYRIPGLGQRTKTLRTLSEAKEFQGSVRDPAGREQPSQAGEG
jgi:hypothetical protein